eukprot:1181397-Prorocentrum_minimum.AAC.2
MANDFWVSICNPNLGMRDSCRHIADTMALPATVSETVRIYETQAWADLVEHKKEIECTHLRDLLQDEDRCASMLLSMSANNPYQPSGSTIGAR